MLRQLQHIRFTKRDELSSLPVCYWYAQANRNSEPMGTVNDAIHRRPDHVHT